jgi:outer membrane protein assembly factor BamB
MTRIPPGRLLWLPALALLAAGCGGHPAGGRDWPLPNRDLGSSRAQPGSGIDRGNVARLRPLWRFRFRITPRESGVFTATPIVRGGTVYLQDMESNVYALAVASGHLQWRHRFGAGNPGPNGLAIDAGYIYGATDSTAFALAAGSGRLVWQRRLLGPTESFVDTAPQVAHGLVYLSTAGYTPGTRGALYALDARSGALRWRFDTIEGPWRYPQEAGGGGAWYPPSVDERGRVYWGTANPTPWGGTPRRPNGGSYPGPVPYTDSLLALDGGSGRLLWHDQVTPHDIRDHDFQLPPLLASGLVIGAGKSGVVIAWDPRSHRRVWQTPVGVHRNDSGPLPRHRVSVCPGLLGGVETPMASSGGRVFVPLVELCSAGSATGFAPLASMNPATGHGELVALGVRDGRTLWTRRLPQPDFGCATVADGVVFTSTFDGTLYGLDVRDGAILWTSRLPAGSNACPSLGGGLLLVGAGVPRPGGVLELVAYGAR